MQFPAWMSRPKQPTMCRPSPRFWDRKIMRWEIVLSSSSAYEFTARPFNLHIRFCLFLCTRCFAIFLLLAGLFRFRFIASASQETRDCHLIRREIRRGANKREERNVKTLNFQESFWSLIFFFNKRGFIAFLMFLKEQRREHSPEHIEKLSKKCKIVNN